MRDAPLRQRHAETGSTLRLVVLAPGQRGCLGADLDSGAFVRLHHPRQALPLATAPHGRALLQPFAIAEARVTESRTDRPDQPEALDVDAAPRVAGQLSGWRLERFLRPLLHPTDRPLLGSKGRSIPLWSLDGDRPSIALVAVSNLSIQVDDAGVHCTFVWQRSHTVLPLEDPAVMARLDWIPRSPLSGGELDEFLGFRPARLVVALSRPKNGHCYKVGAALLPRWVNPSTDERALSSRATANRFPVR